MLRWPTAALTLLSALALTAGPAGPARAEPGTDLVALLTELRTHYEETGRAAEAYRETARALRERRAEADRLAERLAATRGDLAEERRTAGRLAGAAYRTGGVDLPPVLRLLLGEDPGQALHTQVVAGRAAAAQAAAIDRLVAGERRAGELAADARRAWEEQRELAAEERRRRDDTHRRLDELAGLLAELTPEQVAGLTGLETAGAAAGDRAARWALARVGEEAPADGGGVPGAAWSAAGRPVAGAWDALPAVPLDGLRPGDVVLYPSRPALYVGGGRVVRTPEPGAPVVVGGLADEPPLGAVRPDGS